MRRCQLVERSLRLGHILLRPQRMVMAHGLAPVGHHKARIGLLCVLEGQGGLIEFEIVQRLDAAQEVGLRGRSARGGKRDAARRLRLRPDAEGCDTEPGQQGRHHANRNRNHDWCLRSQRDL